MRDAFAEELLVLAKEDPSIELLTGDLGFGVLRPFKDEFPERFHNVGIAEQLMIEMATGMALAGKTVVCYSIGNFPVIRCLEQIRNDMAYSGANVKIIEIGGGYTYGQLGMSHNATEDLACLLPIPGLRIYAPSDKVEAKAATKEMMVYEGPCFMRLERPDPRLVSEVFDARFYFGSLRRISSGSKRAIIGYGGVALEAREAAQQLDYAFYTCPRLKSLDAGSLAKELKVYEKVYVVEEHCFIGGFGSYLKSIIEPDFPIETIGIKDEVAPMIGSQTYMRDYAGLSAKKLIERMKVDE